MRETFICERVVSIKRQGSPAKDVSSVQRRLPVQRLEGGSSISSTIALLAPHGILAGEYSTGALVIQRARLGE